MAEISRDVTMRTHWQTFRFWFWPAFLVVVFTVVNVVGISMKGSRHCGCPFTFASWRLSSADEWDFALYWFDPYALGLDFGVGIAVFYYAWVFAAWRFRDAKATHAEHSQPTTDNQPLRSI